MMRVLVALLCCVAFACGVQAEEASFATMREALADQTCRTAAISPDVCDNAVINGVQCVWCKSAAVPSACLPASQAAKLPSGVFECDKPKPKPEPESSSAEITPVKVEHHHQKKEKHSHARPHVPHSQPHNNEHENQVNVVKDCFSVKNKNACDASIVNGTACVWCSSMTIPASCLPSDKAAHLPPSVFKCDKPRVTDCFAVKDKQTCDATTVKGIACVWCKSAAIPSSCVSSDKAAHLPPSVFACDKPHTHDYFDDKTVSDLAPASPESPLVATF